MQSMKCSPNKWKLNENSFYSRRVSLLNMNVQDNIVAFVRQYYYQFKAAHTSWRNSLMFAVHPASLRSGQSSSLSSNQIESSWRTNGGHIIYITSDRSKGIKLSLPRLRCSIQQQPKFSTCVSWWHTLLNKNKTLTHTLLTQLHRAKCITFIKSYFLCVS